MIIGLILIWVFLIFVLVRFNHVAQRKTKRGEEILMQEQDFVQKKIRQKK